jgi:hypothetical protein
MPVGETSPGPPDGEADCTCSISSRVDESGEVCTRLVTLVGMSPGDSEGT